ncbi:hypothetical protein [Ruegeria hyattellae]|uniref:hypothetical protein n=1 Tax=Ruegeria hyattellae TaxID=3233337 RepID=UPI00355C5176
MNQVTKVSGQWVPKVPQIPVNGTFWTWRHDILVLAGGQLVAMERPVRTSEPGMLDSFERDTREMFALTHLREAEVTGKAKAMEEIADLNKMVWKAMKGQHVAIGPSEPSGAISTRNDIAKRLREIIHPSARRFRCFIGQENVANAAHDNDLWVHTGEPQQPLGFSVDDVCGLLNEPRDDFENPASWGVSKGLALTGRVRQQLDSVLNTVGQSLTDLPQVAGTIGALVAMMRSDQTPFPTTRRPADIDDPDFDAIYNEISTHK